MKKNLKSAVSIIVAACVLMSGMTLPARAKSAQETKVGSESGYIWVNHDKNLEYPTEKTKATASSTQNGYGAGQLLDGNDDTRWEATWNNPPKTTEIILTAEKEEYITGIKYVSRLDNNIDGSMKNYEIFSSEDGKTYLETPVKTGQILGGLGTYFILFDEPVKAKSLKIVSDALAVSEMHLFYIPSGEEDYDVLIEEAADLRKTAGNASGMDIGLWLPDTLEAFDAEFAAVKEEGKPESQEGLYQSNAILVRLISELKRAQLESTTEVNAQLRLAETILEAATSGEKPLTWKQEDINAFQEILKELQEVLSSQVASKGIVLDSQEKLEEGMIAFQQKQKRPIISYNGKTETSLEYVNDGLTEKRFVGSGKGDDIYLELDYQDLYQFESLTFQTWFATSRGITGIKVQYKDENGEWIWADGGKKYSMSWSTYSNATETQKVTFDTPVRGSSIRIYIIDAKGNYTIDELAVGISVAEEDVNVFIDKTVVELAEGESVQLKATVLPETVSNKTVKWTSSDEKIVSVDLDGIITAKSVPDGEDSTEAIITATTEYGAKTDFCKVTVFPKMADEKEKEATKIRLKNARKLVNAAKQNDYKENAIETFKNILTDLETRLLGDVTIGQLQKIDIEVKAATTKFEESSLIPIRETKNLIERITGKNSSDLFEVEMIPADEETGMDVYEVDFDEQANKVVLRGNNGVSLATAYNYYLKYYAYLDFPYVGECDLKLPDPLPKVSEKVRIVFPYEYRHYFNENCEYKYTTSLYGEEEWQHRIDWMAMNGFNMFLIDIGDHAIWYNAKDELGLDDAALAELRRSNKGTEQYYGKYELSQEAVEKEGKLARKVVEMAFAMGMEPEIRPFVGQVPFMFPNQREDYYGSKSKAKMVIDQEGSIFDDMFLYAAARWINLPQGVFISPYVENADKAQAEEMYNKFVEIADIYYESLMEILGYNEYGRTPAYAYKDLIAEQGFVVNHPAFPKESLTVMNEQLLKLNPDAIWMQTSWRYQSWLTQYFDEGNLLIVDLAAEYKPKWNATNEFDGTPWLWSMIWNFGGNTGLAGGMEHLATAIPEARESSSYMKGVSIAPEGGDTNPALYGLMAEMTWRSEKLDVKQWIKDYTKRRYGVENYQKAQKEIDTAWDVLYKTVYSEFIAGAPPQTLTNAAPKLKGALARAYGSNTKAYTTQEIFPVWENMLKAAEKMENITPQFRYDLVDITRQVLADISGEVYSNIKPNFDSGDKEKAMKYANLMVQICEDLDNILATNEEFLTGTRLERAKNRGVTDSDKEYFEEVERTFMTYWILDTPNAGGGLPDYCNRHLSGLMTDYYGMRWGIFAKYLEEALDLGMNESEFNKTQQPKINKEITENVSEWAEDRTLYPTKEVGDSVEISRELWDKYQPLIKEMYDPEASDNSRDIPVEGMSATCGSQQAASGSEGPASNVLDGKSSTIWHSVWAGTDRENLWIDIKLAEPATVGGLRYQPRGAGGTNGIITEYRIEVSTDNGATYTEAANGTWNGNSNWKLADFKATEGVTNVRLYAVDSLTQDGKNYASAAEIRVLVPKDEPEPSVDKSNLEVLIAYAESQKEKAEYEDVVDVVKTLFEKTLAEAKTVMADEKAEQAAVDAAYEALLANVHLLGFTGNTDDLALALELAKTTNTEGKTPESVKVLQDAIAKAEDILADGNVLQEEIDAAREALLAAIDGLEDIVSVDKTKLKGLLEESQKYADRIGEYTKATADAFMAAKEAAQAVYDNPEATQEQVKKAYDTLQQAIFGLRLIPNKDALEELLKEAEGINLAKYTEETVTAFRTAFAKAETVFENGNASETEVKEAEKMLRAAMDGLQEKQNEEKEGDSSKENTKLNDRKEKAAKTGDGTELIVWLTVLSAATVILYKKRRCMK